MILTLQTTTFSARGGIPAYNRMVCRALNELGNGAEFRPRVLIAMDQEPDVTANSRALPNVSLQASGGNRFAFVRRVIGILLSQPIDLLVLGHVNYAPLGMILKRLRPGLRYGVMVHGIEVWSRLPPMKRWALQRADFVSSVSEYTKRKMIEVNGVRPERIRILPDTIDWTVRESFAFRVSSFESDKEKSKDQRARTNATPDFSSLTSDLPPLMSGLCLLSVCRLEESEKYKGIDTVLEALPAVIDRVPSVQYVVIGSGSDLERHRALAAEKGISDRVHFAGSVDDATLRAAYEACDIFVLPSAGEGFGIVFLEAMHYRKPIIVANSGAAPEVIKDKQTGLVVEYGNVAQLATAITKLCLDGDLRSRLGAAGYERLQENFTFNHFKTKLREILMCELPLRSSREPKPFAAETTEVS